MSVYFVICSRAISLLVCVLRFYILFVTTHTFFGMSPTQWPNKSAALNEKLLSFAIFFVLVLMLTVKMIHSQPSFCTPSVCV